MLTEILDEAKKAADANGYRAGSSPVLEAVAKKAQEAAAASAGVRGVLGLVDAVQVAIRAATGLVKPPDLGRHAVTHRCGAGLADGPVAPLPPAASAEEFCTPIENQMQCGVCWCFGATAALEADFIRQTGADPKAVNFSEQSVLDCGRTGGCNGDWHSTAFEILRSRGCVDQVADPYRQDGGNGRCPAGKYFLADWAYLHTDPNAVCPADLIKRAIVQKKVVAAAMYADAAFIGYAGGVFRSGRVYAPDLVNHLIDIVAYDDARGAWKCRNHWARTWGEQGYFWIAYGHLNVGFGAAVCTAKVDAPVPPPKPDPKPLPAGGYTFTFAGGSITGTLTPAAPGLASWFSDALDWFTDELAAVEAKAKELYAAYGPDAAAVYEALKAAARTRDPLALVEVYNAIKKLAGDVRDRNVSVSASPCGCEEQVGFSPADVMPWIELAQLLGDMLQRWRRNRRQAA